jgi:hypothetical protein
MAAIEVLDEGPLFAVVHPKSSQTAFGQARA